MVEIAKCRCGADGRLLTGPMYASVDCSGPSCWTGPIRTTGAEAVAAWNALMSPAAPEPAIVHYEHAIGATIQQMQEAFQKTEMWKLSTVPGISVGCGRGMSAVMKIRTRFWHNPLSNHSS